MDNSATIITQPQEHSNVCTAQTVRMPHLENQYMNISLIAKTVFSNPSLIKPDIVYPLSTIPSRNVLTTIKLSVAEDKKIPAFVLTPDDLVVMDAVYTLMTYNCTAFTPAMVVRIMSGNPAQDVTKTMTDAITERLDKLSSILIAIDCTSEMRTRKIIDPEATAVLHGPLLPLQKIQVITGNHHYIKPGYQLLRDPVLYSYAKVLGQIASVPVQLFRVGGISNSSESIVIRRYLLKRIEAMKNSKNRISSYQVVYEWYDRKTASLKGMFPELGYAKAEYVNWREKKSKLHRIVKSILDGLIASDYISGYTEIRNGSSIRGVGLILKQEHRGRRKR